MRHGATHHMRYSFLFLAAVLAACGSQHSFDPATVQTFNTAALTVSNAASTYAGQTANLPSAGTCTSLHQAYDSNVRPTISQMQGVGPEMDSMMGEEGHMGDADMACSANAMMTELDHHQSAGCQSSTDMGADESKAQRHAAAMTQWANHAANRSHDLGSMMRMSMMGGAGSATGHCIHNSDGSYTLQP